MAAAAYLAVPGGVPQTAVGCAIGAAAAAAVAVAAQRMRPAAAWAWRAVAAGIVATVVGDAVYPSEQPVGTGLLGSTPWSDGAYLVAYALFGTGLVLLARRRLGGRELGSLLDAAVVAVAAGIVVWSVAIAPEAYHGATFADRLLAVVYPVADIALLGVVLSLVLAGAGRLGSLRLLAGALVLLLAGDALMAVERVELAFASGGFADLAWLLAFGFFAAAALHPDAERTALDVHRPDDRISPRRRVLLGVAGLTPGIVLAYDLAFARDLTEALPPVAAAGTLVAVLLVWRFSDFAARQQRTAGSERALRFAAAELAGAVDRESIAAAALSGAIGIAPDALEIRVNLLDGSDFTVLAAAGAGAAELEGFTASFDELAFPVQAALLDHRAADLPIDDSLRPLVRVDPGTRYLGLYPLLSEDERLAGWIVIGISEPSSPAVCDGLYHLASLASLALERAEIVRASGQDSCETWFSAVIQGSAEVISLVEPDGAVRWQTPSIEKALGYGRGELTGRRLSELLHEDDAPELHDLLAGDWEPLPDVPVRARMRAADRTFHSVELTFTDLRHDSRVQAVVVTTRDVTEQVVLEQLARGAAWAQLRSA